MQNDYYTLNLPSQVFPFDPSSPTEHAHFETVASGRAKHS